VTPCRATKADSDLARTEGSTWPQQGGHHPFGQQLTINQALADGNKPGWPCRLSTVAGVSLARSKRFMRRTGSPSINQAVG